MDTNQPHTNLVWHYTINGTGCHNKYRAAMPPPNSGEERERDKFEWSSNGMDGRDGQNRPLCNGRSVADHVSGLG